MALMKKSSRYKNKNYADRIRRKLHEENISIHQFCADVGISYSSYKDYMRGTTKGIKEGDTKVRKLIKALERIK